jgi:hypothetical protein
MSFGISLELKEAKPIALLWVASVGTSIDFKSKLKSMGTKKMFPPSARVRGVLFLYRERK